MATYNGAKYIREQLDDLAAQTHLPADLVVCDDGSTDGTLDIVEQFATAAPFPVRIHRNPERLGYRANFVKAAGLCSSDLIAFCDQDDRWDSTKLERVVRHFGDHRIMLAYHNARVVSAQGARIGTLRPPSTDVIRTNPLRGAPWVFALGFTQVFRRELLSFDNLWADSADPYVEGEPMAHDQWYFFLASVLGTVVYEPALLADYRQHGNNASVWRRPRLLSRAKKQIRLASQISRQRALAAETRAAALERVAADVRSTDEATLRTAAHRYRQLTNRWRQRAGIYESDSWKFRLSAIFKLIANGSYGLSGWRLGPLLLGLDITLGLTGLAPKAE
jgi:hypothetical protein